MIKEVSQSLPVLCALIAANIAAGTLSSMAVKKEMFDKTRMITGLLRALVAIAGVFALAYAFDTIDLSNIGFTPMTIISLGIIVYSCKLATNIVKIAGLDKYIKIVNPLDKDKPQEENKTE